jgi:hypothetical protein
VLRCYLQWVTAHVTPYLAASGMNHRDLFYQTVLPFNWLRSFLLLPVWRMDVRTVTCRAQRNTKGRKIKALPTVLLLAAQVVQSRAGEFRRD